MKDILCEPTTQSACFEWVRLKMLTHKTKQDTDGELDYIKKQLRKFDAPTVKKIKHIIAFSFLKTHPSQIRIMAGYWTKLQSFEELTETNLIKCRLIKNKQIYDSKFARIKAPTSAATFILHQLQIQHLDEEMDKYGYQSLTEYLGEIDGFYQFYEEERFTILSQRKDGKPLFHGQHKDHWDIERNPSYANCSFCNQFSKSLIHHGTMGVEQTNSVLGQHNFQYGKRGLSCCYKQMTKMKQTTRIKQFNYWEEKNWISIDEITQKETKLDWINEDIKKDFRETINDLYNLRFAQNELHSKRYYTIKTKEDEIISLTEKKVKKHKLKFTSQAHWNANCNLQLCHHLMKQGKLTETGLKAIHRLFGEQFSLDFLQRRCASWGFHLL